MLPYHHSYIVAIGFLQPETVAGGIDTRLGERSVQVWLKGKTKIVSKHKKELEGVADG